MKASMSQRMYVLWQRYYEQEPWGPWRDNVHTALIAAEVRRVWQRPRSHPKLSDFMVRSPLERTADVEKALFTVLRNMATTVSPKESQRLLSAHMKKRRMRKRRNGK